MTVRFYSSIAQQTTLTGTYSPSSTVIAVAGTTGFPSSTPYTLSLDYGAPNEELVEVTGVAGLSLTVTRAIDGTSATTHNAGAIVRHVSSARDFADSRAHENASQNVHGIQVGSSVVGTTDTQTLTNKTLTNPTFNNPNITGTVSGGATYSAVTLGGTTTALATGAANTPFVVKGAASQTAELEQWQNSTGTVLASVLSSGAVSTPNGLTSTAATAGTNPVFVKGAASQTAALLDVQDSASTDLLQVDSAGQLLAKKGAVLTGDLPVGTGGVEIHAGPSSTSIVSFYDSTNTLKSRFDNGTSFGPTGTLLVPEIIATNPNAWTVTTATNLIPWTTSTGLHSPSYGNATMNYLTKIIDGTLFFSMLIRFGSTTNFGSGVTTSDSWQFGIYPGGGRTAEAAFRNDQNPVGHGEVISSGTVVAPISVKIDSTGTNFVFDLIGGYPSGAAITNTGEIDSLTPFTWASSNSLRFSGFVPISPAF